MCRQVGAPDTMGTPTKCWQARACQSQEVRPSQRWATDGRSEARGHQSPEATARSRRADTEGSSEARTDKSRKRGEDRDALREAREQQRLASSIEWRRLRVHRFHDHSHTSHLRHTQPASVYILGPPTASYCHYDMPPLQSTVLQTYHLVFYTWPKCFILLDHINICSTGSLVNIPMWTQHLQHHPPCDRSKQRERIESHPE